MSKYHSQADAINHLLKEGVIEHKDLIATEIWVVCPKCTNNIRMYDGPVCKCGCDVENPPYLTVTVGDIVRHKPSNQLYRIHMHQHGVIWGSEIYVDKVDYACTEYIAYRNPKKLISLKQQDLVLVTNLTVQWG